MVWIELESDRTNDSLATDDHYMEEQLTDPVWCDTEDITTDTENSPETNNGENIIMLSSKQMKHKYLLLCLQLQKALPLKILLN